MIIYPAIDIIDGKCVRLKQGSFDDVSIYGEDLVEIGFKWKEKGAKWLHLVDLDGARSKSPVNLDKIAEVANETKLDVQTGGGIRDIFSVDKIINKGIKRVILGTSAVSNPEFVKEAVREFRERIVIGIDAKDGLVAVNGWEQKSSIDAVELAKQMENLGVQTIIYTDISRDGMLMGPNLKAMEAMKNAVNIEVIASGGVASIKDIIDLKNTGMPGVIVGKALYTGGVDLEEALKL